METWKKIGKVLLFPHMAVILLLAAVTVAGLGWLFSTGRENTVLAYCFYPLCAYSLCVLCLWLMPLLIRYGKQPPKEKSPADQALAFRRSLVSGLGINLLYALFQMGMGALTASAWTGSQGAYQLIMALIHLVLLCYERKSRKEENPRRAGWAGFRACGVCLLVLNLTMTGLAFQMIWQGETENYPSVLIFAVAAYTFYKLTLAIIRVIQYKKNANPLWGAAKNIDLSEATMNLFCLQAALLQVFSTPEQTDLRFLMNSLSGTAVCLMTVCGAVGMVYHSNRKLQGEPRNGR